MFAELRWLWIEVEVQVKQVLFEVRPHPRQGGESGFLSLRAGDRSLFLRWRENLFLFKSEAAISLAMAHFLFNFIGVFIFLLIPALNRIPTFLSDRLGYLTLRNRIIGFTYILLTFFLLPFSLIYFNDDNNLQVQKAPATEQLTQGKTPPNP